MDENIKQILENQLVLIEAIDRQIAFAQVTSPSIAAGSEKIRGKLSDCYRDTSVLLGKQPSGFGTGPYGS